MKINITVLLCLAFTMPIFNSDKDNAIIQRKNISEKTERYFQKFAEKHPDCAECYEHSKNCCRISMGICVVCTLCLSPFIDPKYSNYESCRKHIGKVEAEIFTISAVAGTLIGTVVTGADIIESINRRDIKKMQ